MNAELYKAMSTWFTQPGAYVLVDGQYGSTGKGVIAAAMAECFGDVVDVVTSNAAPNSGHTSFYDGEKIVLKQLPTFSVIATKKYGVEKAPVTYLNAGAVIDINVLNREMREHKTVYEVHPHAAMITSISKKEDKANVSGIASTGQGVGPAIINKLRRYGEAVFGVGCANVGTTRNLNNLRVFIEVSQGYSLGLNSGFYPHCTTRECTVSQALSDAHLPPTAFRKSVMAVRTFPIRVGSTENSSGGHYPDQRELAWDELGQVPETTTVTGRIRRVFTWSDQQFREAVQANQPEVIFLNFVNYLDPDEIEGFVCNMVEQYMQVMKRRPEAVLLGYGPKSEDIRVWG